MSAEAILLCATTFAAALVNGALGYGFSSITVPVALLVYPARVLNPAIVLLEVGINLYTLSANRRAVPVVWPRLRPLVAGLLPGVASGSLLLASLDADPLKLGIYATLLPLVLLQAAGWRRPVPPHARAEAALGARARLASTVYAVAEVLPRIAGYAPGAAQASFGLEKRVGGHSFQINVSNGFGTTLAQLARGGVSGSDWFLGFNITRKFF